ncbi:MAG: hypothetical protein A2Z17_01465 [Gammaproteobacteria bacterium RBG_16_66_13]|jgi:hypothetical protein|nr:MAG: hypothetical protein A2Z17_01465 [Gammaproteobacteria bacterium RBG_16_66_13]
MTEKQRPNVVGKGRSFLREAIAAIAEIKAGGSKLGAAGQDKVNSLLTDRATMLESILKMPFIGTVKAGELAWDLNDAATELKTAAAAGDEAKSLELATNMAAEMDKFVHTTKTFVVRMT